MNGSGEQMVFYCGGVDGHVRGGGVGAEGFEGRPFLDDDEGVRAELGLDPAGVGGVDDRAVFDAAFFGVDGGHVGAEGGEDGVAVAGLGGDEGEDVDHTGFLDWRCSG